ncbi:ATP-binding protein [Methylomonas koyamae]|uniref:ATP-binding protein n=1 Tax=Methylomonas koyamae TaxID=702114 RepID=UPI0007C8BB74|nr:ATP-binding protein [Methylomonas koyamae]
MSDDLLQASLFEEDYLLRELGSVAHVPHVALTELVANAWDAGASRVNLQIPEKIGDNLTVQDDGHGMSTEQFAKRWMTLRYNRLKHQGDDVEFPSGRSGRQRKAYGRNGVGRHGLLCFSDEYSVETWRDGILSQFVVGTDPARVLLYCVKKKSVSGWAVALVLSFGLKEICPIPTKY